jgi:hypothetical protein
MNTGELKFQVCCRSGGFEQKQFKAKNGKAIPEKGHGSP